MAEYIERQAAIDAVTAVYVRTAGYKTRERVWETMEAIQKLPAADVAPVVHGTWEFRHGSWYYSNCGRGYKNKFGVVTARKYNCCPNCGARMDGGDDGETD